jgi:hypothetical protein
MEINKDEALMNENFFSHIMEAFYQSDEFNEALGKFIDNKWDALCNEYRNDFDY